MSEFHVYGDQRDYARQQYEWGVHAEIDRLRAELAERDKTLSVMARRLSIADDRADAAEAAIARVREPLDNLMGYLNWHDGTPGSRFRAENVRALTSRALRALDGGTEEAAITYGYVRSWHVIEEGRC